VCKWNSCRTEIAKAHPEKSKVSMFLFKNQVMKTNREVRINNHTFDSRWI